MTKGETMDKRRVLPDFTVNAATMRVMEDATEQVERLRVLLSTDPAAHTLNTRDLAWRLYMRGVRC